MGPNGSGKSTLSNCVMGRPGYEVTVVEPAVAVLDEIDSGLDVDALRSVAQGVERMTEKGLAVLLITHYTRVLEFLRADAVHVMIDGDVVDSGGPELADALEAEG